jgi:hypothetical protein
VFILIVRRSTVLNLAPSSLDMLQVFLRVQHGHFGQYVHKMLFL